MSGSGYSNIPIEVPAVFSPAGGVFPITNADRIEVYDSDGTTIIPVMEWGRYSDANSANRGIHKLVAILPTLGAGQNRQLSIKVIPSSSPTTGTDITVSDVIATGFSLPATLQHMNGSTYLADAATGLQGSSWSNKTTAATRGKRVGGGGFSTSWVATCPLKTAGAVAMPGNAQLIAEITAYKAGRGAVSGPNPIIGIKVQYRIKSAFAQGTMPPVNHWYDLSVSCGSNTQAWAGVAAPAKTCTLTTYTDPTYGPQGLNNFNSRCYFNVPSGGVTVFTQDSVGQTISDGTGSAIIVEYVSALQVIARVAKVFGSTTLTSGTWRTWALNQQYSSDIPTQEIWYNGGLAISAKPNIHSHLGPAWNGTTGGPWTHWRDCEMFNPMSTPAASITNDLSALSSGIGINPCAAKDGRIADWTAYMPDTGGRGEIAPTPDQYIGPLIKFDSNAWAKIFENAHKAAMFPMFYLDENTGKVPLFNNGTDWNTSGYPWGGTQLPNGTAYTNSNAVFEITGAQFQVAHHPATQAVPLMMTGDFFHMEDMCHQLFMCWAQNDPNYTGTQLLRLFCNVSELRGNAWTYRDLADIMLFLPDAGDSTVSFTKSQMTTVLGNQFTATGSGTPSVSPYPGVNIGLVNNTGVGKAYATSGPRNMGQALGGDLSQFQLGYALFGFSQTKLRGMLPAGGDFSAFYTWMAEGILGATTSSDVIRNWFLPIYYGRVEDDAGTPVNTWLDTYRWSAFDPYNGAARRLVVGTGVTLSGLSGSGITVTMPAGYFTIGGTKYIGAPVVDLNSASLRIVPMDIGTRAGFDETRCWQEGATNVSSSHILPTINSGTVKVWNSGATNVYVKLSIGAGTATTSDTLVTPGSYVKITIGSNTYLNKITSSGFGEVTVMGSSGTGYAIGNTITLAIQGVSSNFSITTNAVVTVSDVGVNGDVVSVTISTPGLYIANTAGNIGNTDDLVTHLSTSGSGTGFTYRVSDDSSVKFGKGPLRFGVGKVTGVSGDVLTLTTSGTWRGGGIRCYPFAQTSLVTQKIQTSAPMPGDANGASPGIADPHLPTPYTGNNEYWTIALNNLFMLKKFGFTGAATAYANVANDFTGPNALQWKVV